MQATQSRTASGSVGQSIGFTALHPMEDGIGFKPLSAMAGIAEGAGLAHDAGNLMGALSLYADLLARPGVLYEEHREYAAELRLISDRSWAMIGRLVRHARAVEEIAQQQATVLPEMVERCRGMLSRVAGREIDVFYGAGAWAPVSVRPEAMERILTNLVKNASQSMPREGVVSVRIEGALAAAGRRVLLTVEDTGRGMSSADVKQLMQSGRISSTNGHGLGFRVVRELAAISGGCLNIESRVGLGTKISVEWEVQDWATHQEGGKTGAKTDVN